jgi:hypothetical protein
VVTALERMDGSLTQKRETYAIQSGTLEAPVRRQALLEMKKTRITTMGTVTRVAPAILRRVPTPMMVLEAGSGRIQLARPARGGTWVHECLFPRFFKLLYKKSLRCVIIGVRNVTCFC